MDELRRLENSHDSMDEPLGMLRDPLAARSHPREPRPPHAITGRARELDLWMAAILTVAQVILGGFLSFFALLEQFTFDGCGAPNPECNYSLGTTAFFVVPIACVIALGFTLFGIVRRRALSRTCWWVAPAAFGISLLGFCISMLLLVLATGRGL